MVTNNAGKASAKNMARPRRGPSSVSSVSAATASGGFRLEGGGGGSGGRGSGGGGIGGGLDACDTVSSVSRNSIYKLKIDAMFDDSRSIISQHTHNHYNHYNGGGGGGHGGGSVRSQSSRTHAAPHRSASIRSGSASKASASSAAALAARYQLQQQQQQSHGGGHHGGDRQRAQRKHSSASASSFFVEDAVQGVSNKVQDQIERMFTDVIKDVTSCSFAVRCLGSLPLQEKVTSLLGLQEPLRQLYLSGAGHGNQHSGHLDICASGLRVRLATGQYAQMTPFHNIAVWSAVKFIVSPAEGGAAFLPLITDPENIDKSSLFKPLSVADKRRLSSGLHSPIFAVVMRSTAVPRQLECHAFVCTTPEDAIVIAATLYQSLMTHMNGAGTNAASASSRKPRKPRNQNGVSCISIASSSAAANSANLATMNAVDGSATHALCTGSVTSQQLSHRALELLRQPATARPPSFRNPSRPPRRKRHTNGSGSQSGSGGDSMADGGFSSAAGCSTTEERKKKSHKTRRAPPIPTVSTSAAILASGSDDGHSEHRRGGSNPNSQGLETGYTGNDPNGGDIFTRVAIPRSGSFLNTSGLTRYKSRATRRAAGKNGVGGGGGRSPLGFSELFNEFRLQENLHSLDDILNAIINFDGMSFNDLKPIYKEFLLKLAVTLTKDELYARSKSIMRRQKKKKLRRKPSNVTTSSSQKPRKTYILGSKSLSKVFCFGKHHFSKLHGGKSATKLSQKTLSANAASAAGKDVQTRIGTSGSDVSVMRNELTLGGQNRNSSSGYVSCSECSYDSEACTCASADRCYCSLVVDHQHGGEGKMQHHRKHGAPATQRRHRRHSLHSCGDDDDDKCYCSLGERTDGAQTESGTTWCDSDSCASQTKCYCQAVEGKAESATRRRRCETDQMPASYSDDEGVDGTQTPDNLALDYELFTVDNQTGSGAGGDGLAAYGKPVRASEALSAKKSVEMAALFADYKLTQTTDVQNLMKSSSASVSRKSPSSHSAGASVKSTAASTAGGRSSSKSSHRSGSRSSSAQQHRRTSHDAMESAAADDDVGVRLSALAPDSLNTSRNVSLRKHSGGNGLYGAMLRGKQTAEEGDCQTIQQQRPVSATLEDSLGYLP